MLGRAEGRLQLMFCCRTKDVCDWGLCLREERERRKSVGSLPGFLGGVACGLAGLSAGVGGRDKTTGWGREVRRGDL